VTGGKAATRTRPDDRRAGSYLRWRLSNGIRNSLFLAAIVGLSTAWYVGCLGFYSDDWGPRVLCTAEDGSLPGLIREQFD
jgi:hypothetical protein